MLISRIFQNIEAYLSRPDTQSSAKERTTSRYFMSTTAVRSHGQTYHVETRTIIVHENSKDTTALDLPVVCSSLYVKFWQTHDPGVKAQRLADYYADLGSARCVPGVGHVFVRISRQRCS
jgi:hypothetical protein